MDYLITGGAGFIGSRICKLLALRNVNYFAVDDLSKGKSFNVIDKSRFLKIDCSSREFEFWLNLKKPKHILHLCGQSSGERSSEDPTNDFLSNVLSTRRILSSCKFNNYLKSITFASSMSVYGNKLNAKENDQLNPISWYGRHKLLSENLIQQFSDIRNNVKCSSLRLFNVYGEGQDLQDLKQGMISIFISMAIKQKNIKIKGPSNRIRDFINVNDVVDGFIKASQREKGSNYEVFNIASGFGCEVKKIVELICKETNASSQYLDIRTPLDQDFCSADMTKSSIILDFKSNHTLESELKNMITWAKRKL